MSPRGRLALGVIGVSGIALFVSMWALQQRSQRARLQADTRTTTDQLALRLSAWIEFRMTAMRHVARHLVEADGIAPERFRTETNPLLEDFPGFQALNWVDPQGVIRITVPKAGNEAALGRNLFEHPAPGVASALHLAIEEGVLARTPVVMLLQGERGFGTYLRVSDSGGQLLGVVNGVFQVRTLVERCLAETRLRENFHLRISEPGGAVAYASTGPMKMDDRMMYTSSVRVVDHAWRLCLAPTPAHEARGQTIADEVLLLAGLLATLLVMLLVRGRILRREALARSEARYRSLIQDVLDASPMGIVIVDRAGVVVWLNRAQETYFGVARDEFVEQPVTKLVAALRRATGVERDFGGDPHLLDPDAASDVPVRFHLERGDERPERWIEHHSASIGEGLFSGGRIHHFHDVTRRMRAEAEQILLSEGVAQSEAMVVIASPKGRILYVNPAFERVSGQSRADMEGTMLPLLDPAGDPNGPASTVLATVAAGRPWQGRGRGTRKDGSSYDSLTSVFPVRDVDGAIHHVVNVTRDVSHEVLLESQLRQAQKMDAVGQLAGGVAHDFNNLLQVVLGCGHEALAEAIEGRPSVAALRQIIDASERAAELTRQLLAFGRKQVLTRRVLDLNAVVTGHVGLLRRMIGELVVIEFQPDPKTGNVRADRTQLEQVLMNLCLNARDAMPEGGTISIRTRATDCELSRSDITVYGELDRDDLPHATRCTEIEVADTGTGMSAEQSERAIEPFFTTKQAGEGTGLGLATAYGIVKQHGGMLTIESVPGRGTTVRVLLPRVDAGAEADPPAADPTPTSGTERILVVEDDAMVRRLAVTILESAGYVVSVATDGAQALALLDRERGAVDLVFSDVVMPNMGGRELIGHMRAAGSTVPVLLTTGYGIGVMTDAQARNLLPKPYTPLELLARVRHCLDA